MKKSVSPVADMADEVNQSQSAGLKRIGVGADDLAQLMTARVFENPDGDHLVVHAEALAHVRFVHGEQVVQTPWRRSST